MRRSLHGAELGRIEMVVSDRCGTILGHLAQAFSRKEDGKVTGLPQARDIESDQRIAECLLKFY